jgi:hypothetical protein
MDRPGGTVLVIRKRGRRRAGHSTSIRYLAMVILAEIADKMPSTVGIVIACLVAAGICVGLAWSHRAIAWAVLSLALVVGGLFAVGGYHESFVEGPFSDAVWSELGWPWVAASIVGPLLPVTAVAALIVVRRPRLAR